MVLMTSFVESDPGSIPPSFRIFTTKYFYFPAENNFRAGEIIFQGENNSERESISKYTLL